MKYSETRDGLVVLKATDILTAADYGVLRSEIDRLFAAAKGPVRVLLDWTELQGWDAGGEKGAFALWSHEWADVERMAIVSSDKFTEDGLRIGKILSRATVRHFQSAEADQARAWLAA